MENIKLSYFGQVDLNETDGYYSVETEYNGLTLSLDLNFESKGGSREDAKNIEKFLDSIPTFDIQNKTKIIEDFNKEGEAKDYINFYFDELTDEELSGIVDCQKLNESKEKQLLSKLRLIRVGLYPDSQHDSEYYGVFDYSIDIDGEPCNQLLVVKTDENGNLDHITWES